MIESMPSLAINYVIHLILQDLVRSQIVHKSRANSTVKKYLAENRKYRTYFLRGKRIFYRVALYAFTCDKLSVNPPYSVVNFLNQTTHPTA